MEWEVFEPNPEDEFYDLMCKVAYADMFNGRSGLNVPDSVYGQCWREGDC